MNQQFDNLNRVLTEHSTRLENGENVLIEATDIPEEMLISLVRKVKKMGGKPFVTLKNNRILREIYTNTDDKHMETYGNIEKFQMEKMDAYIGIRGSNNISELSDVPDEDMKRYQKYWLKPVHFDVRVPNTKWVVLRWPSPSMAQLSGMSTSAFEDFYFKVCTLDYAKMDKAMDPLKELMEKTDMVHIKGPGTDLEFSIKGLPAIKCSGQMNIPDGEIFTAPVKDSVNGVITYNAKTIYNGQIFENIKLEFKDGKIIKAEAGDKTEKLNAILDLDEGARYVGEFAIGVNPFVTKPMLDILFDEKIMGSFHFTPGASYDECDNGNKSQVHWDMVNIQTKEWGGGEIWFDGELIRKDGMFVKDELLPLNPENLI